MLKPLRWLAAMSAALLLSAGAADAATILGPFAGSWDGTESVQTDRIFRNTVASDGTGTKLFPGVVDSGDELYEVFSFYNNGPQDVVTIDVTVSSTDTHFSAWFGSFYDPVFANNAPNYLGDLGGSVSQAFSILVPANSLFLVVASTNFWPGSGLNETFSFTVEGDFVETVSVPEPATLLLLGTGLGAVVARRRLRKAV